MFVKILCKNAGRLKSIGSFRRQASLSSLHRNLTLLDLICIGIGSTLGSGVFVLTGLVANKYAGPGVIFSWAIAGFASYCSATSFAELCCLIPSSGSIYSYVYVSLGELLGYLAAACLTLECGVSSSAIARNWGVKLNNYLTNTETSDSGINLYAGLLETLVVMIFLFGVEFTKWTLNGFTIARMFLFAFMIVIGLSLFSTSNFTPIAPYGFTGILQGATPLFFGLVGFEEVCCMHAEAIDPFHNLPVAIFATVGIVTAIYCLCALALVSTIAYTDIDRQSGFSMAFHQRGAHIAANITVIGELVTLPIVVLASFLPQPRIQFVLAQDKLIPRFFAQIDSKGNLFWGILTGGVACILIALLVPFRYMDDVVSAGVLLSFIFANSAVILIRCGHIAGGQLALFQTVGDEQHLTNVFQNIPITRLLLVYFLFCIALSALINYMNFTATKGLSNTDVLVTIMVCCVMLLIIAMMIFVRHRTFARSVSQDTSHIISNKYYTVPCMPFTPLLGILANFYLICQLSMRSLVYVTGYFVVATLLYFSYQIYRRATCIKTYRGQNGHPTVGDLPFSAAAKTAAHESVDSLESLVDGDVERSAVEGKNTSNFPMSLTENGEASSIAKSIQEIKTSQQHYMAIAGNCNSPQVLEK